MKMTKDIYGKMAKQASPPSTFVKNSVMAFLFGGAICTIGQGILEGYLMLGMDVKESACCRIYYFNRISSTFDCI